MTLKNQDIFDIFASTNLTFDTFDTNRPWFELTLLRIKVLLPGRVPLVAVRLLLPPRLLYAGRPGVLLVLRPQLLLR